MSLPAPENSTPLTVKMSNPFSVTKSVTSIAGETDVRRSNVHVSFGAYLPALSSQSSWSPSSLPFLKLGLSIQPLPSTVHGPEVTAHTGFSGFAGGGGGGLGPGLGPGSGPGAGGPCEPGVFGKPEEGIGGGTDQCVTKQSAILKPPLSPQRGPHELSESK